MADAIQHNLQDPNNLTLSCTSESHASEFRNRCAQKVVTARATIPFTFWAQAHEFQAGDYLFDNAVPGSASIRREGTNLLDEDSWEGMEIR